MRGEGRNIMAICDCDGDYAVMFMEYLNRRGNLPFDVKAFTSADILCDFGLKHHIELLLISERALRSCDRVRTLRTGKTIVLWEEEEGDEQGIYDSVYKYQPSDCLVREVMSFYDAERKIYQPVRGKAGDGLSAEVIGISGLCDPSGACRLALACGAVLAAASPSNPLYINLMSYTGMERLMRENYSRTVSDLMLFYRSSPESLPYRFNEIVHTFRGLDYIPPVFQAEDLKDVSDREWADMIASLTRVSGYEKVVLAFGSEIDSIGALLDISETVWVPFSGDPIQQARLDEFRDSFGHSSEDRGERDGPAGKIVPVVLKPSSWRTERESASVEDADFTRSSDWNELRMLAGRLLQTAGERPAPV